MHVLVVHNRYSSRVPSGENLAVNDEVRWLREAGVEVTTFEVSNDDVFEASRSDRLRQAAWATWSLPAQRRMTRTLDEANPDLVHVHNLFPLLSTSVPWVATRRNLPIVWTVHNHRVACIIGTNFRDGAPCNDCRPGWRLPGIRHGCYGGSRPASALATGATSIFGRLARRSITPIAISQHVKDWLVSSAGFNKSQVRVKYNGVAEPRRPDGTDDSSTPSSRRVFLFASYLTDYKGVRLLLDAWRKTDGIDAQLRIVGNGPLANEIRHAATTDARITWAPQVSVDEMDAHYTSARVVVVPSTWDEPFGRGAAEALAHGLPVITSGTGGLREIVDETTGWITSTNADTLAEAIAEAAGSDDAVSARGTAGVRRYHERFSPHVTTRALLDIYDSLLTEHTVPTPKRST